MKEEIHVKLIVGLSTLTFFVYRKKGKCWYWDEDYLSLAELECKYPDDKFKKVFLDD